MGGYGYVSVAGIKRLVLLQCVGGSLGLRLRMRLGMGLVLRLGLRVDGGDDGRDGRETGLWRRVFVAVVVDDDVDVVVVAAVIIISDNVLGLVLKVRHFLLHLLFLVVVDVFVFVFVVIIVIIFVDEITFTIHQRDCLPGGIIVKGKKRPPFPFVPLFVG